MQFICWRYGCKMNLVISTELPIVSPMLHALVRQLERWEAILQSRLDMFSGAPDNYIAGLSLDTISGMPGSKLQALFNPNNTPFM